MHSSNGSREAHWATKRGTVLLSQHEKFTSLMKQFQSSPDFSLKVAPNVGLAPRCPTGPLHSVHSRHIVVLEAALAALVKGAWLLLNEPCQGLLGFQHPRDLTHAGVELEEFLLLDQVGVRELRIVLLELAELLFLFKGQLHLA